MTRSVVSLLSLLLTWLAHPVAQAQDTAREWLERMSAASQSLNYTGIFVYQHQGRLDTMQIVHAMDENGERERLVSLTGPEREVLRDNQMVTCILGDRQSVQVNKSRPRTPFPVSFPKELMQLEQYYRFEVLGEDRVAGLSCRVVAVQPRDEYRYGRRLCVHEGSHLLLRSELTGADGRAVEQVMFTSVEFPEKISAEALLPQLGDEGFTWQREPEQPPQQAEVAAGSRWRIGSVPDGFMLIDHKWHRLSRDEQGVEHWVYSDGLASLSVYVEQAADAQEESYDGVTHRGALTAYGTAVEGYHVTVIGEVPGRTVEMVAKSVEAR